MHTQSKQQAKLWRVQSSEDALTSLEILRATYTSQTFARHTHDSFALGVVEHGQLAYFTETKSHLIPPGDIIVINPGQVHWGGVANDAGYTYRIFYPDRRVLSRVMHSIHEDDGKDDLPYFAVSQLHDPLLAKRILQLLISLETESALSLAQDTYLTTTLTHLITHYSDPAVNLPKIGPEMQAVKTVCDYIEACYADNISLSELAALVDLKPLRLLRVFRQAQGLPPHAYLLQVRINHAKTLLAQGMKSIDVAFATGFADQSHFNRHFKRFVGVTPGQYAAGC
jgi:AraC-like DNA-binding protein